MQNQCTKKLLNFSTGIPIQNMIGLSSDKASVMMDEKGGVRAYFEKTNKNLYVMGCICHSLHLCSSAAWKTLPHNLEILVKNVYTYFSHSLKRLIEFQDIQELFGVKVHKILRTSSTCWTCFGTSTIFHGFKSWKNENLGKEIFLELSECNKLYFSFIEYDLKLTNKMNIEYQSEKPRIQILLKSIKGYFKIILSDFMIRDLINNSSLEQFVIDETVFDDGEQIYLGPKAALVMYIRRQYSCA